ncbi:MAG: heme-binding domain-containing protein [Chloroflexi bacterium]|nr:heme-binding domain-containing protein [Chloroflexota bacterium]
MKTIPRIIGCALGAIVILVVLLTFGAILLETNPPIQREPAWDSAQTKELAQRACYDCHSNETVWPLYTKLPIGSWLAVFDTFRGRRELNFSEWSSASTRRREGNLAREIAEVINEGSMPPRYYVMLHPTAALTAQEKQQLIQGLQKSLSDMNATE